MIGTSPRVKDAERWLHGAGRFVDDLTPPGLVHLGVVRSPHAHARIVRVDATAARRIKGVLAVWTAAEVPELAKPVSTGGGKDRPYAVPVLAGERARYVGEPVACVIAETAALVADALAAVNVEYAPLPALVGMGARGAKTRVHEAWADNVALEVRTAIGDAASAFAAPGLTVVRERFRHQRLAAMPIECRGAVADYDAAAGVLTVWASIQSPYVQREAIARVLGLPNERVRVIVPDVGGAFGPKGQVYADEILVAAGAYRLRRPVKWIESRREHLATVGHDREQEHAAAIAFAADGTIAALEDNFLADTGAYPVMGNGMTANTMNHLPGPYRVPHYRAHGESVVTTTMFNAAYRAAGRPEANYVMERLMDLGARRLGLDPADLRRKNLIRAAEMPYRPGLTYKDGVPVTYDPGDYPAAFERLLRTFGYDAWRKRQKDTADTPRPVGVGLAIFAQGTGLGPFEGATVRVDPQGKVFVLVAIAAQGQAHSTTLAQIAAGELGAKLDDVVVLGGDTSLMPYGMGTGGSRVMANAGPAVARTAAEVRERASAVAAELFECAPADVRFEASRAFVAGMPDRSLPLARVAQAAIRSKAMKASGEPGLNACTWFYPDTVTWAFGGQACAVEVDVETCRVRVLRHVTLHDPGRAIHPVVVEGQLQGGVAQGIGAGLMEDVVYDANGQLLSGSLMDYALPKADDLPWLEVVLDEHPSVINPLGVKGVGESGCIAGASAVANAIEDALASRGVVVRELPVTPARLHAQLARR
ncbi:MAG TPA: xanthine dehydrogenase family protein molybdopterin-binding subunit [Methylomirabilota bacterium]|jgi:carbon-monoxide dehydrogenase large subunit|nr:xanthine dehydrogenase family protein molybdopterin-binding subunit [Methylomirabilota bacterium]